jgi:hypothetical protein
MMKERPMNLRRRHMSEWRAASAAVLAVALLGLVGPSPAAAGGPARRYYLALGDSLAASEQPNGDLSHGYAEQLHAALAVSTPKLTLIKLGCGGESTVSMRFGSQDPANVSSCGSPDDYRHLYPKGSQLLQAVRFLTAHRGQVALITIDIGGNDSVHLDDQGNAVFCAFEPAGCGSRLAAMAQPGSHPRRAAGGRGTGRADRRDDLRQRVRTAGRSRLRRRS